MFEGLYISSNLRLKVLVYLWHFPEDDISFRWVCIESMICQDRGPGLILGQSIRDLWWTKWHRR